jgi:hypothetical protein
MRCQHIVNDHSRHLQTLGRLVFNILKHEDIYKDESSLDNPPEHRLDLKGYVHLWGEDVVDVVGLLNQRYIQAIIETSQITQ